MQRIRTRFRRPPAPARAVVALAVAAIVGFAAAITASARFDSGHYLCTYQVGGEALNGTWTCPDGIAYALPLLAVSGTVSGLVLCGYLLWELWRADARELRQLSEFATVLGAGLLLISAVFLLVIGMPTWLYLPYGGVAAAGLAVRHRSQVLFFAVLAVGVAACIASLPIVLTAPAAIAAALVWSGAMLLRFVAEARWTTPAATPGGPTSRSVAS